MAEATTKRFLNTKTNCIEETSNKKTIKLMTASEQYVAVGNDGKPLAEKASKK